MMPFFSVLLIFTNSTLTHVNERIRLDGLRFAHLLSVVYPDLVAEYGCSLLPSFFKILSSNRNTANSKGTFNPNSKMGLMKSRDQVLESFLHFLGLFVVRAQNLTIKCKRQSDDGQMILEPTFWSSKSLTNAAKFLESGSNIVGIDQHLVNFV
jgi:hypothetical protein